MAWCRTGNKPLSEPMMAMFSDACMCHWANDELNQELRFRTSLLEVSSVRVPSKWAAFFQIRFDCRIWCKDCPSILKIVPYPDISRSDSICTWDQIISYIFFSEKNCIDKFLCNLQALHQFDWSDWKKETQLKILFIDLICSDYWLKIIT